MLTGLLRRRKTRSQRRALEVLDRVPWLAEVDLDRHGLSRKDMDRLMTHPSPLVQVSVERFNSGRAIVHYGLTDRGVHEARMLRGSDQRW